MRRRLLSGPRSLSLRARARARLHSTLRSFARPTETVAVVEQHDVHGDWHELAAMLPLYTPAPSFRCCSNNDSMVHVQTTSSACAVLIARATTRYRRRFATTVDCALA
jgi:hypothetical protein